MDRKDTIWTRRTNNSNLSLSTPSNTGQSDSANTRDLSSLSKRNGGPTSSHGTGRSNPFNSLTTPGGLASPTGGASAFGLGSGAFASFGSAKTPKTPGNPFDAALAASAKTPGLEKTSKEAAKTPGAIGKPSSNASLLSSASDAKAKSSASQPSKHPLRDSWTFWYRPPITKANGYIEYEKTLHGIAAVDNVEDFYAIYRHLKRPSTLPLVSDYHLFRKGVRPIWEDDENKKGGKWIVRLKKGVADRYWEDLLLAIIGDQFGDAGEEVCGVVLSVRNGEDILSIWTRNTGGRVLKIREIMKRVLTFPPETRVEWKSHDASMQQRTAIEESRREKAAQHRDDKRSLKNAPEKQPEDQKP